MTDVQWTHNGAPVGNGFLGRSKRLELEQALAYVRRWNIGGPFYEERDLAILELFGLTTNEAIAVFQSTPSECLTVRVAIAIRAVLRADEDARCLRAVNECRATCVGGSQLRVFGAQDALDEVRDWPRIVARKLVKTADGEDRWVVHNALWEVPAGDLVPGVEVMRGGQHE